MVEEVEVRIFVILSASSVELGVMTRCPVTELNTPVSSQFQW